MVLVYFLFRFLIQRVAYAMRGAWRRRTLTSEEGAGGKLSFVVVVVVWVGVVTF